MLISFTVENLFSFRDKVTLDMRASAIKAHGYSLIEAGRHKLLPVAAIYGANASGKTNLVRALSEALNCMVGNESNITFPFLFREQIPDEGIVCPTYTLKFIVHVEENPIECEFSFSLMQTEFFTEELKCADSETNRFSRVYSREWDSENNVWILSIGKSKLARQLSKAIKYLNEFETDQNRLFLSALGKWATSPGQRNRYLLPESIYKWVQDTTFFEEPMTLKYGVPNIAKDSFFAEFAENQNNRKGFNDFLRSVNPMIKSFDLTDEVHDRNQKAVEISNPVFNYNYNLENFPIANIAISATESKGVWTAMFIYPSLHKVLIGGGILIVDELENSLHPLLMAEIINLFTSPDTNPGGGQLIFTTHNALLMSKKYFRQDEIVFVEKDEEGASDLYRLSDIEGVRSDLDFCKNYILGAFGAVPEFPNMNGSADA